MLISSKHDPGRCLMRTDESASELVSQSERVSQSVIRPRVDVLAFVRSFKIREGTFFFQS